MDILSRDDKQGLERRLDELKNNRRTLSDRIAEAREHGDLKENGEYHAAREQQGLEEAEIRRIEQRLASAQVIEDSPAAGMNVVFLGSTVRLREVETGDEDVYKIVGEASGDLLSDVAEVTVSSPMGQALLKASVGEIVRVDAPRGMLRFEVVELL